MADKKHEPLESDLQRLRSEGKVFFSRDLTGAAGFGTAALLLFVAGPALVRGVQDIFRESFQAEALRGDLPVSYMLERLSSAANRGLGYSALFLALAVAAAILAQFLQTGPVMSAKPLAPDFERFNPANRLKSLFGVRKMRDWMLTLMKFALVLWVVLSFLLDRVPAIIIASRQSIEVTGALTGELLRQLFFRAALLFAVLGTADFLIARYDFRKDHSMDDDELKRKLIQEEGNPEAKALVREAERELLEEGGEDQVAQATLVTKDSDRRTAAAFRHDRQQGTVTVVAKGTGRTAGGIESEAHKHKVPVHENPAMTRAAMSTKRGQPLSREHFAAASEAIGLVERARRLRGLTGNTEE